MDDKLRRLLALGVGVHLDKDQVKTIADHIQHLEALAHAEMAPSIRLSVGEIQSGFSRVRWAEGLICQLPSHHEGAQSWLLNYGTKPRAEELRAKKGLKWDSVHECAIFGFDTAHSCIEDVMQENADLKARLAVAEAVPPIPQVPCPPMAPCYGCGVSFYILSKSSRCTHCENKRAEANAQENDALRERLDTATKTIEEMQEYVQRFQKWAAEAVALAEPKGVE